jgi:predicted transcriptional regulator
MDEFSLGDRELDVMNVLWELRSGTVAEVRERLPADLAYTTVLTILRNLEEKGLLSHTVEGRAHRYLPAVERGDAGRSAVTRLIDKLFGGSAEQLLVHLVEHGELGADDLARLQERIRRGTAPGARPRPKDGRGRR